MSVFANRVFDGAVFANYPKCTKAWARNGSGCLLTAFWAALGFVVREEFYGTFYVNPDTRISHNAQSMCLETDSWAAYLLDEYEKQSFSNTVITYYDTNNFEMALHEMFKLIEVIPKKQHIEKASVILPCLL